MRQSTGITYASSAFSFKTVVPGHSINFFKITSHIDLFLNGGTQTSQSSQTQCADMVCMKSHLCTIAQKLSFKTLRENVENYSYNSSLLGFFVFRVYHVQVTQKKTCILGMSRSIHHLIQLALILDRKL